MRLLLLLSLGCTMAVVGGCDAPSEKPSETSVEDHAATAALNRESSAGSSAQSDDWISLSNFLGQYPADVGLLDKSVIADDLRKLMGGKFPTLKTNLEAGSPLQMENNVFYFSGNRQHQGGKEAAYVLIQPQTKAIEVGLWEKGKLTVYENQTSAVAMPRDIQILVNNDIHHLGN